MPDPFQCARVRVKRRSACPHQGATDDEPADRCIAAGSAASHPDSGEAVASRMPRRVLGHPLGVEIVGTAFPPLIGQQCWGGVKCGWGSWVTFEFGDPHVWSFRKVRDISCTIAAQSRKIPSRQIGLRGDWHLWIHNCFWRLLWNGEEALAQCAAGPERSAS